MSIFENDADIEQGELEAAGNRATMLRKRGICLHGWLQGNPADSSVTCLDCGAAFASSEAAYEAGEDYR